MSSAGWCPTYRRGVGFSVQAAAAAAAWLLGLLPSTMYASWSRWPVAVVVPAAVVLGAALLCTIGVVQWLELRRHLPRAGRWIAATAVAWCLGLLAFTAITSPLWQPGQDAVLIVAIGAVGGLAMAATMAAVTGWALVRLVRPRGDGSRESAASQALPQNDQSGCAAPPQHAVRSDAQRTPSDPARAPAD